jgi:tRNA(Arg) A34 adenosine deaminase TadA
MSELNTADLADLATTFGATLPDWVLEEITASAAPTSDGERMALVHRLAARNFREGSGGPFAALVADCTDGAILSVGVNLVLASGLSGLHAEMVALSLAQTRLQRWDLSGHGPCEIVVNWRPCVMCYGAVMWSGVQRLVIAGEGDVVEELTGFDEGPMVPDWKEQFARRGIEVVVGVQRQQALETFADFGRSGAVVYNGRQSQA